MFRGRAVRRPRAAEHGLQDPGSFHDSSVILKLVLLMVARRLPVLNEALTPCGIDWVERIKAPVAFSTLFFSCLLCSFVPVRGVRGRHLIQSQEKHLG